MFGPSSSPCSEKRVVHVWGQPLSCQKVLGTGVRCCLRACKFRGRQRDVQEYMIQKVLSQASPPSCAELASCVWQTGAVFAEGVYSRCIDAGSTSPLGCGIASK